MPYVQVNDLRLYYQETGKGVPFVLLHGASGSIDCPGIGWGGLMGLFASRYRAIHIEHRGHGRTDNPAGKMDYAMLANDLAAFIEALGLAPAHVGGVSDGAITALHLGMTRPELARTLVCVGPNYYNDALVEDANRFAAVETIERMRPAEIEDEAQRHDRGKEPGYWRELFRQLRENLALNPAYTLDDLAKIPLPTLLMAGERDLWGNVDQMVAMRRAIPTSELLIVNNAGHTIQFTHPQIVGPVVMDFLARYAG
jgi:pimeloyl-ACP methyl ester carboxylesterase